jgi:hypothetical protein
MEKHKSKYKKPENTKYKSRKDLKDYTTDDKAGALNPYSTKQKQSNVLRKTDKNVQDDGKYDVKYNADDRLYKDLEDGEYDAKHAAKVFKKRQDKEEKETVDVIKDKVENLTREQRERLVREYVRRKIVKVILEQTTPEEDKPEEETPPPADAAPSGTTPPPAAGTTTPPPAAAGTTTPPPADAASSGTTPPAAAGSETKPSADAAAEVSPETKEALAVDQFVNYLKKQESVLGKLKKAMLAINLSLKEAEPEDKINFFKMLKLTASKQLDTPAKKTK